MIERVKETIEKYRMIEKGEKVVCGYSGGSDSTFLFIALRELGYSISLAYMNHMLREDSEKEEEFVRKQAGKFGLELYMERIPVKKYAEERKLSLEEAARNLRYEFFERARKYFHADKVALGHNLDDLVETFFMRLLRGSGFGLSSIPPVRGYIVRPLIEIRREEIIKYLKEKNIPFYKDPSNHDTKFLRNRLRHEILPFLERNFPNLYESVKRSVENLRDIEEAMEELVDTGRIKRRKNFIKIEGDYFYNLPQPLKFLMLKRALSLIDRERGLKRIHIKEIEKKKEITLSGVSIHPGKDIIIYEELPSYHEMEVEVPGIYEFNGWMITLKKGKKEKGFECFSLEDIEFPVKIRMWREGDRMVPFGMKEEKKLQDIFVDEKVPRPIRRMIPIIEDRKGILVVGNIKRAERGRVRNNEECLLIKVEEKDA